MNLKFYKTGTKPTTVGSLWFNPTTKRIELITGTSTSDVYGSDIQDATYSNNILTIEKIDGSAITINLSNYATSSELENSLANKLNKIKVNNSTVNSVNLNIVGSGGTTVSNNSGTITISSETTPTSFDASAITSGTIDLERLPKGALERLFIVFSENDAMRADCQEGDTVQVTGNNNKMYFCVNGSATTFANKFREYTAGAATSVPWSGVTGRPNVEDGAQKNVQSDWNAISGDAFILNKPAIPTKTSQLTNDSNFLTEIPIASDTKVGGIKVSTNSGYSISNTGLFELNSATSTSKGIVSIGTGLTVNSGKVTLNTATSSNLGGVIVPNNGTISVDTSGNISVSDKVALKTDLNSKQDAITYSGSLESNVTLVANSLIDLGPRSSAITVLLPSTASHDHKEYWFRFTADSTTAPSLSLPSSVLWQDGKTPTIKPGETYEFCITDTLVTYSMFKTAN